MKRYVCFVDGNGFAVVFPDDKKNRVSYTMYFDNATDALSTDWSDLMKKKKIVNYHLLLSFKV